ncbi:filamentous hemagglutinin [Nostoc sp. CENA543]|uniref:two-partner secretion domain-containing protein n=1 Tax=Nostoc sp. CENA543 TaxID=1869241 RepID=UPI000CA17484|nr:filamentous hemagglutinin N-terminal domain-containing protein [Nostoc sp. CENA543]AUT00484.1 filamentous hemagglutinin [Nostoc sp. CENA543]
MSQNRSDRYSDLRLVNALAIASLSVFSGDCVLAQINQDQTLGLENSVVTPQVVNGQTIYQIDGGSIRGNNLFHSFENFSLYNGNTAYFNNTTNIQNIFSRVTGNSISNIDGILKTNGTANLFFINPNGIVFGSRAALDIQGSFLATTADRINFANNLQFSASNPQTAPLLAVNVPTGLQFGTKLGAIKNQSQASLGGATNRLNSPAGLQVQPQRTLALVGGDLILQGGNLTAKEGRIELGSVGVNSIVHIQPTPQGWKLGYENVRDLQKIQLTEGIINNSARPSQVDVSGEGSGSVHLQGKQILVNSRSQILANTLGKKQGGNLTINASESVELVGLNSAILTTVTFGAGNAGNLEITTGNLIVKDVAQVRVGAQFLNNAAAANPELRLGSGGKLIINASESVVLTGSRTFGNQTVPGGLFAATADIGDAGDIFINTKVLRIDDGAILSTESAGRILSGGNYIPAIGRGGNVTVNASESIEVAGISINDFVAGISTTTRGTGKAGNLNLTTDKLIIRDRGAISVSSAVPKTVIYLGDPTKLGAAGEININARSIRLENGGQLIAESEAGMGGNITLKVQDLLLMRRQSQISTSAGKTLGRGDGGNVSIDIPNGFIVGASSENNDITANAFAGNGGKININTERIFGFVPRTRADLVRLLGTDKPEELKPSELPTNDITAFSQQNSALNGDIQINTPDVDNSQGIVELPTNLVDTSQQITSTCSQRKSTERSSFISTGRGGISVSPMDTLSGDTVLTDWINVPADRESHTGKIQPHTPENTTNMQSGDRPPEIIEAQGWIVAPDGNIVLVAQAPTATPHSPALKAAGCGVH